MVMIVGRDKELAKMRKALDKAMQGKGQSIFVSGEAGLGITTIVQELLSQASKEGFRCLKSKCLFREGGDPYLPFTEALKEFIDAAGKKVSKATSDDLGHIMPMGLIGIGTDKGGGSAKVEARKSRMERRRTDGTDYTKERERMFAVILDILEDLTKDSPMALFLDDLHWADTATLQLMSYVIKNSADQRLLVIGAYRTAEVEARKGHHLKDVITRARREGRNTDIRLRPLGKEDIEVMIKNCLEVKDVPSDFLNIIQKETEGNPFFIDEFLRSLVQEGVIPGEGADLKQVDIKEVKVPSSVADLVGKKFDSLEEQQRKVMEYAAVIGEEFPIDLLGSVIEMDEMALIDLLERLIQLGMVEELAEGDEIRYKFSYKQFREVIYDRLSSARRRLFHKKVGQALEKLPEKVREKELFALAHHLSLGQQMDKAIMYTTLAAERAERSFAAEDAITFYEKVLELQDRLPVTDETPKRKKDLVAKIAELKFLTESWSEAMLYLKALEKVAEASKDDLTLSEVYRKMGHIERTRGSWTKAFRSYDKALEISERIDDETGIADALQGLGHIHGVRAEYDIAQAYLEKSMQISEALEDTLTLGRTHLELGHVFKDQGQYDDALGTYTEGLMLLESEGDMFSMTRGYMSIGDLCMRTKEWDKAIEFYGKAQKMAIMSKDLQMQAWAQFKLGECNAHNKDFETAEDLCGKALMNLLRTDDRVGQVYVYSSYGAVFRLKGDFGKAFVQFQQAMSNANDLNMPIVTANINLEMGLMYKDKNDTKGAKRFFEKSKKLYEKIEAHAMAEQANRLLKGLERYEKPKDIHHYLDKSMKAMQRRTSKRKDSKKKNSKNKNSKKRKK